MKTALLDQAHTYTDFQGLNQLKAQSRHDKDAALKEVSKQFESLFISMMLKSMRDVNKVFSEGNYLNSNQTEFYQQMFDSQLSLTLSKGQGIGIAENLYHQLSQNQSDTKHELLTPYRSIQDYPRSLPPMMQPQKLAQLPEVIAQVESVIQARSAQVSETVASEAQPDLDVNEPELSIAEPQSFSSPQEFVEYLYPYAVQVERETGIQASVMLAQSALETGWGKHMIRHENGDVSHNLFGIKADARWDGNAAEVMTTEYREGVAMKETASFRAYDSYADSFRDYAAFLQDNPRYKAVFDHLDKPEEFTRMLQEAGYATDPAYSDKINRIMKSDFIQGAAERPSAAQEGQPLAFVQGL